MITIKTTIGKNIWAKKSAVLSFLHHINASNYRRKDKNTLKKIGTYNFISELSFPEHNNKFFWNVLFSIPDFFIQNGILIFCFRIFIFRIKSIFGIFEIVLGAGSKCWV